MLARLVGEFDLELTWKGFELHPGTPRGGTRVAELFGAARYEAMRDNRLALLGELRALFLDVADISRLSI